MEALNIKSGRPVRWTFCFLLRVRWLPLWIDPLCKKKKKHLLDGINIWVFFFWIPKISAKLLFFTSTSFLPCLPRSRGLEECLFSFFLPWWTWHCRSTAPKKPRISVNWEQREDHLSDKPSMWTIFHPSKNANEA